MFNFIGSICVGDKTSCGAVVATGTPATLVNGRAIARVGDMVGCRYSCKIVSGNPTEIIDGAPMAVHGSQTERSCICISNNNEFHGDALSAEVAASVPTAADSAIAYMPEMAAALSEEQSVEFRLIDAQNRPLANEAFLLTDPAGQTFAGSLDGNGYAKVGPVKAGICSVRFPGLHHEIVVAS